MPCVERTFNKEKWYNTNLAIQFLIYLLSTCYILEGAGYTPVGTV